MVRLADLSEYEREHVMIKDVPPVGPPVWVKRARPLKDMRIALITTAGLHFRDDELFRFADATFRAIPGDEDAGNLVTSHSSSNFDRSGFQEDVNLVFPIDRFRELDASGVIGSLADIHYSFMGAGLLPQVYEETVGAVAALLKKDKVDAVFLTPVCPNCTRAVNAIAYFLEREGIMTTGISLVRENTQSMAPPRMLWVSFPIGFPLGKPGDADFQHGVIGHALELFDRPQGPVLEDYPVDIPHVEFDQAPACPVNFARPETDASSWKARLNNELMLLSPWYDMGRRRRGRTTFGISGWAMGEILDGLARWLDHRSEPELEPLPDLKWFKYAMEDAKAWYSEALSAQPGDYPVGHIQRQLWGETVLGAALKTYHEYFDNDPKLKSFARIIASRDAIQGSTGHFGVGAGNEQIGQSGQKGPQTKAEDQISARDQVNAREEA